MTIRLATERDLDQMAELWEELMQYHAPMHDVFKLTPGARRIARRELAERLRRPATRFLVADLGKGRLAGMIATSYFNSSPTQLQSYQGYIGETVVRQSHRGLGIGERLVSAARQWLKGLGVDFIELQVSPDNPRGVKFWEEMGFSVLTYHMTSTVKQKKEETA